MNNKEIEKKSKAEQVDFDATFLEESVNVTDQVEIYSIVNSLTELSNVLQVQLTVNGSPDVMLRNNISLSGRFEMNRDMITVPEESEDETEKSTQETTQEAILPEETDSELPGETIAEETTVEVATGI